MWATKEYRTLCTIQDVLLQAVTDPETSERDKAQLARAACAVIQCKLEIRQSVRANRALLAVPAKESLLIEAPPTEPPPREARAEAAVL